MQRLMIQTVRMSDAGEYSVVAGSSMSKAHLTVEGKDVHISAPAEKDITVITVSLLPHFTFDERRRLILLITVSSHTRCLRNREPHLSLKSMRTKLKAVG